MGESSRKEIDACRSHAEMGIRQKEEGSGDTSGVGTDTTAVCPEMYDQTRCNTPGDNDLAISYNGDIEDSLQADDGDEIQVLCPECDADISQAVKRIHEDQIKAFIAKIYRYFVQEYEELKKSFSGLELTPLSKFRQRTALATGVSETVVADILQEEARQQQPQEQPSQSDSQPPKRPRQTDGSLEEDADFSGVYEAETLVVKDEPVEEPFESYNDEPEVYVEMPEVKTEPGTNDALADPISIDFKTEPQDEEATTSNETFEAQSVSKSYKGRKTKRSAEAPPSAFAPPVQPTRNVPPAPPSPHSNETVVVQSASKSYKGWKTKRSADAPPTAFAPPVQPTRNVPPTPASSQLPLLDDDDIKMEDIDIEEGFI